MLKFSNISKMQGFPQWEGVDVGDECLHPMQPNLVDSSHVMGCPTLVIYHPTPPYILCSPHHLSECPPLLCFPFLPKSLPCPLCNKLINLISLNILVFVHLEFFGEFANVILVYPANAESNTWAQKLSSPQHCHLNCG